MLLLGCFEWHNPFKKKKIFQLIYFTAVTKDMFTALLCFYEIASLKNHQDPCIAPFLTDFKTQNMSYFLQTTQKMMSDWGQVKVRAHLKKKLKKHGYSKMFR